MPTLLQLVLLCVVTAAALGFLAWMLLSTEPDLDPFVPPAGLQACKWCGGYHPFTCPYVESFEYNDDGLTLKRVVLRGQHYRDLQKHVLYGEPADEPADGSPQPAPLPLEGVVIAP